MRTVRIPAKWSLPLQQKNRRNPQPPPRRWLDYATAMIWLPVGVLFGMLSAVAIMTLTNGFAGWLTP